MIILNFLSRSIEKHSTRKSPKNIKKLMTLTCPCFQLKIVTIRRRNSTLVRKIKALRIQGMKEKETIQSITRLKK